MTADTHRAEIFDGGAEDCQGILDHAPAPIWASGADGTCAYVNLAWLRFTGQGEREALGRSWLELAHPDDRAEAARSYAGASGRRKPFGLELRLRTASGAFRRVLVTFNPRFAQDGAFRGCVQSLVDIHDWRETQERLRAVADTVPAFVWFASRDGELNYLNRRWYEYSGQTPDQALPTGWVDAVHPEDVERVLTVWAETRARGEGYQIECRFRRRDGVYRWYMVRADPMSAAGKVLAWVGTSIDIHDLKGAEERQALLINELNHRVKNTLATVQALAAQILQASPEPEHFREGFEDRLIGLAQAHDLLTAGKWAGAPLSEVVDRALAPWCSARIEAGGPDVWLDPQQALSISMALHELATNAAKYGSLSRPTGKVIIGWTREPRGAGDVVRLHWSERGGPVVTPPLRRGFGSRLLERGLGRELQGSVALDFLPEGASCEITFPLHESSPSAALPRSAR
jgi:PAS domain S-box-containing protein